MPGGSAALLPRQYVQVGRARVAHLDAGVGLPVLLLHGCPFSSFAWREVIAIDCFLSMVHEGTDQAGSG